MVDGNSIDLFERYIMSLLTDAVFQPKNLLNIDSDIFKFASEQYFNSVLDAKNAGEEVEPSVSGVVAVLKGIVAEDIRRELESLEEEYKPGHSLEFFSKKFVNYLRKNVLVKNPTAIGTLELKMHHNTYKIEGSEEFRSVVRLSTLRTWAGPDNNADLAYKVKDALLDVEITESFDKSITDLYMSALDSFFVVLELHVYYGSLNLLQNIKVSEDGTSFIEPGFVLQVVPSTAKKDRGFVFASDELLRGRVLPENEIHLFEQIDFAFNREFELFAREQGILADNEDLEQKQYPANWVYFVASQFDYARLQKHITTTLDFLESWRTLKQHRARGSYKYLNDLIKRDALAPLAMIRSVYPRTDVNAESVQSGIRWHKHEGNKFEAYVGKNLVWALDIAQDDKASA